MNKVYGGEQVTEQILFYQVNNDEEKESMDWWSKYYASRPDTHTKSIDYPEHFDKLTVSHSKSLKFKHIHVPFTKL